MCKNTEKEEGLWWFNNLNVLPYVYITSKLPTLLAAQTYIVWSKEEDNKY